MSIPRRGCAFLRVTGAGRSVTVSNVDGYLVSRLVFFLMIVAANMVIKPGV